MRKLLLLFTAFSAVAQTTTARVEYDVGYAPRHAAQSLDLYLPAHLLTPADIFAVIGLSPPVDLSRHPDGRGYGDVLLSGPGAGPFNHDELLMKDVSPIQHVARGFPPTLLVVGENDFPMLAPDARAFARKAESAGGHVEVVIAAGKDHMGVARGLATDGDPVLTAVQTFLRHKLK